MIIKLNKYILIRKPDSKFDTPPLYEIYKPIDIHKPGRIYDGTWNISTEINKY